MLKGAVAGTSPTGPWTDRRTANRTPDHDERQPWRIPLDRPCLLPKMALVSFIPRHDDSLGGGITLPTLILLPSFPGGADICAELGIWGEGVVAGTATGEVVVNNATSHLPCRGPQEAGSAT